MKARADTLRRDVGVILLWVMMMSWSGQAAAQPATGSNQPGSVNTNQAASPVSEVERAGAHPLTFRLERVPVLRDTTILGEPVWKYLAFVIYVLLAVLVAKLIHLATHVWLKRLASRTKTTLDDILLELVRGPIKVVVFALVLNMGLGFFNWSTAAQLYLSKGLILVVAVSLTWLAVRIVDLLLKFWERRAVESPDRKFQGHLFVVLRTALFTFVVVVAVLVTAQNMNVNITAALASLSIGGLAVGLAAQDTLANLFGAVAIFVDKPFQVGDQIKVDATEGVVETVGLRSTRLRNPDGYLVAVPNKTMGNATITNISERPGIKTVVNLVLARTLPVDKIKRGLAIASEIYGGHAMTEKLLISFNQITPAGANIQVVHWWKGTEYPRYLAGIQEMNLALKERFDAEAIQFAAP